MGLNWRAGQEPVPGYRLIEVLGGGGFGEVWKAEGPGGIQVALKGVRLDGALGQIERRSLDVIRRIRHPQLLSLSGVWTIHETLIIAMELADRTLLDRFKEAVGQGFAGIPAPEIHELFLDAARGLDFLNEPRHHVEGRGIQGIQHRDVKPHNLLLMGGGVKVADYGLARALEQSQTGHTGSKTPLYTAPEFFRGTTSSQSDQYCLAVTYCRMRGGRPPFQGNEYVLMMGHLEGVPDLTRLPASERSAVSRALAKDPKDRWPSCRAFIEAVRAVEPMPDSIPVTIGAIPSPSSAEDRPARPVRKQEERGPPTQPPVEAVRYAAPVRESSGGRPIRPPVEDQAGRRPSWQIVAALAIAPLICIATVVAFPPRGRAVSFFESGNAWYAKREYDKAIADYDEAIRLDPDYALAYMNRAAAYRTKGDTERAEADEARVRELTGSGSP